MSFIYILIGAVVALVIVFYVIYLVIASLLIGANSRDISTDQKEVCKKAVSSGKAGSPYCRLYIQKGKCGNRDCDIIK